MSIDAPTADETTTRAASLVDRIMHWAAFAPDQPAVVHGAGSLTYQELVKRSTVLCGRLAAAQVGPGARVALLLDRSADLVVAALAVVMRGGVYVGLDRREPAGRLATMLRDAEVTVVLTRSADTARTPAGPAVITVDTAPTPAAGATHDHLTTAPTAEAACYVTYTSGSTGTPKGVVVTHGGVTNLIDWHSRMFDVRPGDRMPQLALPSFDGWALEVWPCLAAGATLCVPEDRLPRSAAYLADWLCAERITTCFLTTALGQEVLALPWEHRTTALRAVLVGGERLTRFPRPDLPFRVFNVYGPTETAMLATCGEVGPPGAENATPDIGAPLTGVRAYVLDQRLEPVPPGGTGELYLAGAGVALGYLGRPGLTAARFLADPFGPPGTRMYASGDLAGWTDEGRLQFAGRRDNQVKLRGFRIELGEVEATVRRLPGIRDAVVVLHRPAVGGDRLVAYVRSTATPDPARLRAALADLLPEQMVPGAIVVVDTFPHTPHGKVDRQALAAALPPAAPATPSGRPPNRLEGILADVWCSVLGIPAARPDDSFFDLGGDSLTAMRVAAKARALGIDIGAEDLFEHEVLAELVAALEAVPAVEESHVR